ncbi:MAG: PH domain-containing protein [Candidatus Njordarchaeales archaeon]
MVELLEGEKIITRVQPHPVSFWPYYLFFIYYLVTGAYVIYEKDAIISWASQYISPILGPVGIDIAFIAIWWIILIIPALIFSILRISWRWVILYVFIAAIGTYAVIKWSATPLDLYYVTIGVSIIGIILADLYRRGHEYILTNYRIIAKLGFLGHKERDILYSKITDVVLDQGFLGRILDYGTIIPLTASGLGTGEDLAKVAVGTGVGRKTPVGEVGAGVAVEGAKGVTVPRGRSSYILYGVPNPEKIKKIIDEQRIKKEEAPYLQKTVELLEKLVEKEEEKEE